MTSKFEIGPPKEYSPTQLLEKLKFWDRNPLYQRQADVWTDEKRAFFIDSLINGFLIPPIYLHEFVSPVSKDGVLYSHAVVDGKQRLSAIEAFFADQVTLDPKFLYEKDRRLDLHGKKRSEIKKIAPRVLDDLNETKIPVVSIRAGEPEYINQLFSRLNEGESLNNAERRNAFTGPFPSATRRLAVQPFFLKWYPRVNKRYHHFDVAAKFLIMEERGAANLRASELDDYAHGFVDPPNQVELDSRIAALLKGAEQTLQALTKAIPPQHVSLRGVGTTCVLYLMARKAKAGGTALPVNLAAKLEAFEEVRHLARQFVPRPGDKAGATVARIQRFNTMNQRNEGESYAERLEILEWFFKEFKPDAGPLKFLGLSQTQLARFAQ